MGKRLDRFGKRHFAFRVARKTLALALAASQLSLPISASAADWSKSSFANGNNTGQVGAQQQNARNNSMAQGLATAGSVLSMAAGGLYMVKGAEQLRCCSSGCTGNGSASQTEKKAIDDSVNRGVQQNLPKPAPAPSGSTLTVPNNNAGNLLPPGVTWNNPAEQPLAACPNARPRSGLPALFRFYEIFLPPKADAALGPCVDALLALATGGLMLLNGIMGLQAANQSGHMADSSLGNMGNMASYPGTGGTGNGTPDRTTSSLGNTSGASSAIKLDPALLRTGRANDIMSQFENKFGIGRDQFAKSVMDGEDPRKIFNSAPKNALSNNDINKATNAAKNLSDADKANALAGTALSDAQKELAAKFGSTDSYNLGGGQSPALSAFKSKDKEKDGELEELKAAIDTPAMTVSPEVQAAIAAKEKQDRMNGITDQTIFQVVHAKYRERSKMIFGFDPDGVPKGVANSNGL